MITAVHERKEAVAGFDVGRHGPIYWAAGPVYHRGEYIGATRDCRWSSWWSPKLPRPRSP
jgi:hypothetical protein